MPKLGRPNSGYPCGQEAGATIHPAWRNNAGVGWVDTGGVTVLVVFVTKVTLFGALAVTLF